MNNQEVFTKVVTHLRKQRVKSYALGDGCLYRGPNKTSCAVGCLIPDSEYFADLEQEVVRAIIKRHGIPSLRNLDIELLTSLQIIHDKYEPDRWEEQWYKLAVFNRLTFTPLER
jgi:hypothetical protein